MQLRFVIINEELQAEFDTFFYPARIFLCPAGAHKLRVIKGTDHFNKRVDESCNISMQSMHMHAMGEI